MNYKVIPFSNAEFEKQASKDPMRDYAVISCEKSNANRIVTKLSGAEALPRLFEMDPTIRSYVATPFKVVVDDMGRQATLIPDFQVTQHDGVEWCVFVSPWTTNTHEFNWIGEAASVACSWEGKRLVIVTDKARNLGAGLLCHFERLSRGRVSIPDLAADIVAIVEKCPGANVDRICEDLNEMEWPERNPRLVLEVESHAHDHGHLNAYLRVMREYVFRAVRDGYVDTDFRPRLMTKSIPIYPGRAFLKYRNSAAALLPHVMAGDKRCLEDVAKRSWKSYRWNAPTARITRYEEVAAAA